VQKLKKETILKVVYSTIFGDGIIGRILWPPHSPNLNPCGAGYRIKSTVIIIIHDLKKKISTQNIVPAS
jgi:hypothetical protein